MEKEKTLLFRAEFVLDNTLDKTYCMSAEASDQVQCCVKNCFPSIFRSPAALLRGSGDDRSQSITFSVPEVVSSSTFWPLQWPIMSPCRSNTMYLTLHRANTANRMTRRDVIGPVMLIARDPPAAQPPAGFCVNISCLQS